MQLECASCGMHWDVRAKPDGTMPQVSRCPRNRGGCGKSRWVPRAAGPAVVVAWKPPSESREPRQTAEQCPGCAGPLTASPRGTVRACLACRRRVIPPAVLAPYERGEATGRQVKSQREADLEALDLAGRKGTMLGQLRSLADGDRLDDASRLKAEWFADEVKKAASGKRLDDLAALFTEVGIRARRWYQARPVITAGYADDEEEEYEDEDDDGQDDEPAAVVLATPASIAQQQHRAQAHRMTWAGALAALGWRLSSVIGECQVIDEHSRPCRRETMHNVGTGWVCSGHYGTLAAVINRANYEQQRGA